MSFRIIMLTAVLTIAAVMSAPDDIVPESVQLTQSPVACKPTTDGRCGPQFGGKTCSPGDGGDNTKSWLYCSQSSWCGKSDAHKKNGQKAYDFRAGCTYPMYTSTTNLNLKGDGALCKAGGIGGCGDGKVSDAAVPACKTACNKNPNCVGFVSHPWGGMMKNAAALGCTEMRAGFTWWLKN